MVNEKRIISVCTLLSTLLGYFYAKQTEKDPVPFSMVAGFVGAIIGEIIATWFDGDDQNKNPPAAPA